MAWDEALKLNKQYNALLARRDQIDQEIATFRREKLGMGEEREEEKKEPTLEEWAQVYAEMFGKDAGRILKEFQSLQAEMSEEERKELRMPVYGEKGLTAAKAWAKVKAENPTYEYIDPARIKTKGETDKAFVAFIRFSQEADADSLGENAKRAVDWEKTGQKYASPKILARAREAFRRLTGKQMDERNWIMCPGSRSEYGGVPYLYSFLDYGEVSLYNVNPENRDPYIGVRRVVSRELKS